MASVSVRELQHRIKRVIERVERGESIEVTRRRKTVARLIPADDATEPEPWPDLDARARSVMGDRMVTPSGSEMIIADRGDR